MRFFIVFNKCQVISAHHDKVCAIANFERIGEDFGTGFVRIKLTVRGGVASKLSLYHVCTARVVAFGGGGGNRAKTAAAPHHPVRNQRHLVQKVFPCRLSPSASHRPLNQQQHQQQQQQLHPSPSGNALMSFYQKLQQEVDTIPSRSQSSPASFCTAGSASRRAAAAGT